MPRGRFIDTLLPWLIGTPISIIIIHTLSL
jgi:hypothetical protein